MRSKFKWIFTLLVALSMQFSFAQDKTVTGVVTDNSGPLPGANVVVKGTKNSTQTDFDGKYTIKAKAGDVLEASFTGYSKKTVTVGAGGVSSGQVYPFQGTNGSNSTFFGITSIGGGGGASNSADGRTSYTAPGGSGVGGSGSGGTLFPLPGTAYTGSGGGGSGILSTNQYPTPRGTGGSGVVHIRYLKSAVGL